MAQSESVLMAPPAAHMSYCIYLQKKVLPNDPFLNGLKQSYVTNDSFKTLLCFSVYGSELWYEDGDLWLQGRASGKKLVSL